MGGLTEEIGRHLDVSSTRLTRGTNLFANVPPDVDVAHVTVIEAPGQPPVYAHGSGTLPAWERPRVQLVARSTKPSAGNTIPHSTTARELIHAAWTVLSGVVNTTIASSTSATASTYLRVAPVQSPFLLGQEDDGRLVYAFNAEAWRVPSTSYE